MMVTRATRKAVVKALELEETNLSQQKKQLQNELCSVDKQLLKLNIKILSLKVFVPDE